MAMSESIGGMGSFLLLLNEHFLCIDCCMQFGIELKMDVAVFLLTDVIIIANKKKSGRLQLVCPVSKLSFICVCLVEEAAIIRI